MAHSKRKRAIEISAAKAFERHDGVFSASLCAASLAYEAGRIEGLREAARIIETSKIDEAYHEGQPGDDAIAEAYVERSLELRERANEAAKKWRLL